jgi:glycosyltransferase involved in cell wall biosynthesis
MKRTPQSILVVGGYAPSLTNFRGPLLAAMVAAGHRVAAAAPGLTEDVVARDRLAQIGVATYDVPFVRAGLNPWQDLCAGFALWWLLRALRPECVLCYTVKPVIWGTLAAWLAGVPRRYALITGLGYAFTGAAQGKRLMVQRMVCQLYRLALGRATKVFFQNSDDEALFRALRLLPGHVPSVVVNGSGVDLAYYAVAPLASAAPRFLLIARLLGDKGIREYAAAAELVRTTYPQAEFHLVGGDDPNPDAISGEELRCWQANGTLVWHGPVADVRPHLAACHVFVLPSYREGTPRTVLEAMAMARAIITTDAPGCRETVVEGGNGMLVSPRVVDPLVVAMQYLLKEPEAIARMGAASRRLAEEKYDVRKVNAVLMAEMKL